MDEVDIMISIFRLSAFLNAFGVPLLPRLLYMLNRCLFSVVLPPTAVIGNKVTFAYQGLATVVHARTVIGHNCYVGPNVIIGGRSGLNDVPSIGNNVFIGAGARILGPVKVGHGATIGAASLVLDDIPPGVTVAGVPARQIDGARSEAPTRPYT